ncbi:hypothetical protein E2F50_21730 [Rhizobium deserti]|uniref:Uncharacterized protein n=1 Tax=Rhizobium deserti TaxID=2547961 RepID=A0A4R5U6G3_9HYPH|nr:hypothetical protein [Rhizobium deserti]TDK29825.1 hypothetical protein E2F50_21730 [Rhizobium deserti]
MSGVSSTHEVLAMLVGSLRGSDKLYYKAISAAVESSAAFHPVILNNGRLLVVPLDRDLEEFVHCRLSKDFAALNDVDSQASSFCQMWSDNHNEVSAQSGAKQIISEWCAKSKRGLHYQGPGFVDQLFTVSNLEISELREKLISTLGPSFVTMPSILKEAVRVTVDLPSGRVSIFAELVRAFAKEFPELFGLVSRFEFPGIGQFEEQPEYRPGLRLVVQFDSPRWPQDIWGALRVLQTWAAADSKTIAPNWAHPYSRSIYVGQGFHGLKHYLRCFDLLGDYYDEPTGFFATKTPLGKGLKRLALASSSAQDVQESAT